MSENEVVIVNPANLQMVRKLQVCNRSDMDILTLRARTAQEKWKTTSLYDRLQLFNRLKRYIQRNYQEFISVIQSETGKTWPDAMVDVISAVAEIYNIEKNGVSRVLEFSKPVKTHPFLRNKRTTVPRRPKGVVGIISPWNLPLAIPAADIFPALFRGNAVIWKPSEFTPLSALKLKEAMIKIGFPDYLLQVAVGYGETGAALCEVADCIVFTGSCATGEKVKAICDGRRISYHLEMGGKAPAIVLADANIDRTVYGLLYGAFSNNGHYCKAFEVALIHRSIFNEVVNRLLRLVNNLVSGKDYGPIITKQQLDIVKNQVEQARALKAYIAGGWEISGKAGYWYQPTVILWATEDMDVVRKETFGPVLPIIPFDNEEEAIRLATKTHLGLNASIFTKNEKNFYELAERLSDNIGNIVGNDAMVNWFITEAPQCGRKRSVAPVCGLERHGYSGDERFDDPNTIVWHKHSFFHLPFFKDREPWLLPYNGLTNLTLKAFLRGF
ncbi:MAG: aldehyde dehydrogenase family protein [Candidatus Yanofskybacteria bacterium]|nr:aldehyde dehydrogenase family protein [Candidatus Yanofskybacteria bacterium]